MKFYSTRDRNRIVSFREAVFQGLSPDGGLYNPAAKPDLRELFSAMDENTGFADASARLCAAALEEDFSEEEAYSVCEKAFTFKPEITDAGDGIFILELYHGPSCAFKDFGASFLASSMELFLTGEERKAVILTATSGDTGSAVAQAFHNRKNIEVVILYPSGRVSPLQEKQLTTLGGNVKALEVKGSFDDCQQMVKEAFVNPRLSAVPLTSANSINLGRLFPQSFYYVDTVNKLKKQFKNIVFCVPSGNFGNLTAGVLASQWGLPVKEFIASTNVNKAVPQYLESGIYSPRSSVHTSSNAMDVGNPSNFERLADIFDNDFKKMGRVIKGDWVDDKTTIKAVKEYYEEKGSFIDPHTAVGYVSAKRYREKLLSAGSSAAGRAGAAGAGDTAIVTLSTAHPGKFLEVVEEATGKTPPLPPQLEKLKQLEKQSVVIENTGKALEEYLSESYSALIRS